MKKLLLGVLTGVLVLSAGSLHVSAACHGAGRHGCAANTRGCVTVVETPSGTTTDTVDCSRSCYVDENEDGVCDLCGTEHGSCADGECFIDADGDGICDNCNAYHRCGTADGNGPCYVDANGDGICDNYDSQAACPSGRSGHSSHHRRGCHR